mmetsp:Transcript_41040/g.91783  ORF Transcript_41040/g.91783 Transcript_41040/m.91783 type:complete len:247 (-) Transcript_41040:830-1570(-)
MSLASSLETFSFASFVHPMFTKTPNWFLLVTMPSTLVPTRSRSIGIPSSARRPSPAPPVGAGEVARALAVAFDFAFGTAAFGTAAFGAAAFAAEALGTAFGLGDWPRAAAPAFGAARVGGVAPWAEAVAAARGARSFGGRSRTAAWGSGMETLMRPISRSSLSIVQSSTSSPMRKRRPIAVGTLSRASRTAPMSTNTPYGLTLVTRPWNMSPSRISSRGIAPSCTYLGVVVLAGAFAFAAGVRLAD